MRFSDAEEHALILYTYAFSANLASTIGKVIRYGNTFELEDVHTTTGGKFTTLISVMENDHRATVIAKVSSIEDAKFRYPELFI